MCVEHLIKKADILIDKIERGVSLGKVSSDGLVNEKMVRESKERFRDVMGNVELTNDEFIKLLKENKRNKCAR